MPPRPESPFLALSSADSPNETLPTALAQIVAARFFDSDISTESWTELTRLRNQLVHGLEPREMVIAQIWERLGLSAPSPSLTPAYASLTLQAFEYAQQAKAASTLRAYASDWADFASFCQAHALTPLPAAPHTIALYLSECVSRCKTATLSRRLAAISQAHQAIGLPSPTGDPQVRQVMQGIRRVHGQPPIGKRPLSVEHLRAMVAQMPDTLLGMRDRAVLLVGFASALRRAELVALDVPDGEISVRGLILLIRRSKTDGAGEGRKVFVPRGREEQTCPVRAWEHWLIAASIASGAVFRRINRHNQVFDQRLSGEAVALIVKRWVAAIGMEAEGFAGHSLRAGLATAAALAGKSERIIMQQTGHKSLPVLRRYIRDGEMLRENAAEGLGL